jgi:hypothetical protein
MTIYYPTLDYYVYAYLRGDGTPYYIGKGKGRRYLSSSRTVPIPTDKNRIIFLESNLTEIGALALERRYIAWYGRKDTNTGILRNRTDGGDGSSGLKLSEEVKKIISQKLTGRTASKETRNKLSKASTGRKRTEESKNKVRASMLGKNKGKKVWNSGIKRPDLVTCLHCKKTMASANYYQWHNGKC